MNDYKQLEELIKASLEAYKEGFNETNDEFDIDFFVTVTSHKVDVDGFSKDVAYLRLERAIKPKAGGDEDWEYLLIYNQAYKFKNVAEQTDPRAQWKFNLFLDLAFKLISGGLEYAELLKRMQQTLKANGGAPIADAVTPKETPSGLIITKDMPKPLNDNDKAYLEWVKKNGQKTK